MVRLGSLGVMGFVVAVAFVFIVRLVVVRVIWESR
jgi:hypothetical protein